MIEEDRCTKCNCILTEDNWVPSRKANGLRWCRDCYNETRRIEYENQSFEQRLMRKIRSTLYTHRKRGIDIIGSNKEFMHTYTGHCALCGEEFDLFADDRRHKGSIDRINNDSYMTPDNIQRLS